MFELVLLAMVAGFILLRLRSELGKKTGNEPLPPAARPAPSGARGRVIEGEAVDAPGGGDIAEAKIDPAVRKGLQDIRRADPQLDAAGFTDGAEKAYQMILEAFWAGDRDTLKEFLDEQVYSQFEAAIAARERNGYRLENRLLRVTGADLVEARLHGRMAELTVLFKAEIIAVTRDADGKVVEGDVSDAVDMNDRWTFARDTASADPDWTLVATRAG